MVRFLNANNMQRINCPFAGRAIEAPMRGISRVLVATSMFDTPTDIR